MAEKVIDMQAKQAAAQLNIKRKAFLKEFSKKYLVYKLIGAFVCLLYSAVLIAASYASRELISLVTGGTTGFRIVYVITPLLFVASAAINWVLNTFTNVLVDKMGMDAKLLLSGKVLKMPSITDKYEQANLLRVITADFQVVVLGNFFFASWLLPSLISIVSVLTILFVFSPISGVITVVAFPVVLIFSIVAASLQGKKMTLRAKHAAGVSDVCLSGIRGAYYLRRMEADDYLLDKQQHELKSYNKYYIGQMFYGGVYSALVTFLVSAFPIMLFVLTIVTALFGHGTINNSMLIFGLASTVILPMQLAQNAIGLKIAGDKNYERVSLIYDFEENKQMQEKEKINEISMLDVKISGFRYNMLGENAVTEEQKTLLEDFALNLKRGESAVIMGESGKGKSTLLKFLSYELQLPSECGSILVNGKNLQDVHEQSYYRAMQYVPQSSFLFKDSLRGNLCLGQSFDNEQINEAISCAVLEDFVAEYTLDKEIEEGSKNISGGQLQRICLARALLRKPSLLILDEPTSALDELTTKKLIENLKAYSKKYNCSLLMVTHNPDLADFADKVVRL